MKKKSYLIIFCLLWAFLQTSAVNVTPQTGVFYKIIQTPSNMVFGALSIQPVVQKDTTTLDQAFEFIPVEGLTDTYYIRNYSGMYLNKKATSNWSTIYETTTNTTSSQWVIVDDASSTTAFRLMLVMNSKYLATDGITTNSYMYCDKAVDHANGIFTLVQTAVPSDINVAYKNLTLGSIDAVTSDITLPSTVGTTGVTVRWASSNQLVVDTLGHVTRPAKYNTVVKLTATLSQTLNGITYTLNKIFTVKVLGVIPTPEEIAEWNFSTANISVTDKSINVTDIKSGFKATLVNDASIRTIGTTQQINVLDLGSGTGYLDMGTEIGKTIYSLSNYTMCCYFRVDDTYTNLTSNGNFIWTFSNTADAPTEKNGYIIGHLNSQIQEVTPTDYQSGNQGLSVGSAAAQGSWHHFAYVQKGDTGTIYVDGILAKTGSFTNLPATTITIAGRTGTLYNWLGRSCYPTDAYLQKTLLYDFRLLSFPVSADDLNFGFEVPATIDKLNVAYGENPDYKLPELTVEQGKLDLGDLSAVTSNITLPSQASDPTVSISWKSSNNNLIDSTGMVTRPNYFSYPDTLTATLSKNGQKVFKAFPAMVVVKDGTQYTNNLLVKYDFSSVTDSVVTDVAEKHFTGVLKNNALIRSIGSTVKYNVLSLGDSIGYFDMGTEVGKLMYNLNDFTVSAYVRIDSSYTGLHYNGNFLWNFSNTKNALNDPTGYLILSLRNQASTISPTDWNIEQTVTVADSAFKASWHNFTYTQSGTTGTLYVDGMPIVSDTITSLPSNTLRKSGQLGTLYNWIGRSCYTGDVYLRKSLVYDFRLYSTALTDVQIQNSVLNVGATVNALNAAYEETPNALKSVLNSTFRVIPSVGAIKITGLVGNEKVFLYDITGRQLKVNNPYIIPVNTGIYIVRINNYVTKVIVR